MEVDTIASKKIDGIVVKIGADTSKLGDALKDINKQSTSLSGELKEINNMLKLDPGNTELLVQKQKVLAGAVDNVTARLKVLKEAEKQVQEQFEKGEVSEAQVRALQREIIATERNLKTFERAIEETNEAAKRAADGQEDFADAAKKAGDAADDAEGGFTVMKGALADLVSNVIQGAISAVGNLVGSLMDLSEATEEYRTMQAKLSGSAETFGYSVDFATSQYERFYKYLGDDQMATNAITNLMGIGAETDTISKIAEGATAVWATYGDSIPIEGLTESINETITVGKVTGTMADSINWAKDANVNLNAALSGNKEAQSAFNAAIAEGLPVEDAFNEALAKITDTQERADVVAQFLNTTYGESKQKYDEMTGSVQAANEAELALKDTQAQLGEAVAPVNTALTNLKDQALVAITPLVQTLADAFMNLYNWMQEHPAVAQVLTGIVVGLAAAFSVLAGALAIQGLISGVAKAFAFLNTTMLANPITLIIAAIAALVAAFIYLWNNCEGFRNFWINLWNKIKAAASAAGEGIKKAVASVRDFITQFTKKVKSAFNSIKNFVTVTVPGFFTSMKDKAVKAVTNLYNNVVNWFKKLPSSIQTWLSNAISKVATWGTNMASKAKSGMQSVISAVTNTLKNLPSKVLSIGKDLVSGLWNGITDKLSWLKSKISGFASSVLDSMRNLFGTHSPSKETAWIGEMLDEGLAEGMLDHINEPVKAMQRVSRGVLDAAAGADGLALDRQLHTAGRAAMAATGVNSGIADKLDRILSAIERGQVLVIDGDKFVGATANKYDTKLGQRRALAARGAV